LLFGNSRYGLQGLALHDKKKYVWKMLYIYMLGYDVDFGHMETVSLISAPKYPEKQVRFYFCPLLIVEDSCINPR
jgi:AP-2 complex subunit alpha